MSFVYACPLGGVVDEERINKLVDLIDRLDTEPERKVEYRLNAHDARWLAAIGISPTRHRSRPSRSLPPFDEPSSFSDDH